MRRAAIAIAVFLSGCTTYIGVARGPDAVYLTGNTSFLVFSSSWVKRCREVGDVLHCAELEVQKDDGGAAAASSSSDDDGDVSDKRPVARAAADKANEEAAPEAPAPSPDMGVLGVATVPGGAIIELDGRVAGKAPLIFKRIKGGEHTITARWPDGKSSTIKQVVEPGKTVTARLFPP